MADYILSKGWPALSTYNSSAAAGVTPFRFVKLVVSSSATYVDLATSSTAIATIGVVQDGIDQVKVATGKAAATVAVLGQTYVYANTTPGAIAIGSRIAVGSAGGAKLAVTSDIVVGICTGMSVPGGTVAAGDLIQILLTPAYVIAP
jgi:hypothetical protein